MAVDAPSERGPRGPSDWARLGRGSIIPILLLVGLLVVLGRVHIDLATGYTAPRVVADGADVLVFFDEGGHEPAFYLRRSDDAGRTFGKRVRVPGVLGGAVVHGERLVALLADEVEGQPRWFYSLYDKKTLERSWSGVFTDPELGLTFPGHLARLGRDVYAFGSDEEGALRAARLGETRAMLPTPARLPGAASPTPAAPGARVPPPAWVTSAEQPGPRPRLLLFWRVLADPAGPRAGPGEVRWTTFDAPTGEPPAFGATAKLPFDLVAAAAVTGEGGEVLLLGVPNEAEGDEGPAIHVWRVGAAGPELVEKIPYEREGLAGKAGVAALAATTSGERLLVVAQIGGSIRYRARDGGTWSEWQDVARVPTEQRAVVYGWFGSLLALAVALILQGLRAYRGRPRRRPPASPRTLDELCARALEERARPVASPDALASASPAAGAASPGQTPRAAADARPPAGASSSAVEAAGASAVAGAQAGAEPVPPEAAPLPERLLAFLIDLGIVLVSFAALLSLLPGVAERAATDPRAQLALGALFVVALVAYFALLEALFARTPGKRLLDLEVQDLEGGRPSRGALLFRNLFRVELLLPPPYLALLVSLAVMLVSPQRQRPGDLLARTAVRRVRPS